MTRATKYNINLVSSALSGIYMLISEISGERKILAMEDKPAIIIVKGKNVFLWTIAKRRYKKIEKALADLLERIKKNHGNILDMWTGDISVMAPIEDKIKRVLGVEGDLEKIELEDVGEEDMSEKIKIDIDEFKLE